MGILVTLGRILTAPSKNRGVPDPTREIVKNVTSGGLGSATLARLLGKFARNPDFDGGTNIEKGTPLAEWFFMPTERHSELFVLAPSSGSRALEENGPLR